MTLSNGNPLQVERWRKAVGDRRAAVLHVAQDALDTARRGDEYAHALATIAKYKDFATGAKCRDREKTTRMPRLQPDSRCRPALASLTGPVGSACENETEPADADT